MIPSAIAGRSEFAMVETAPWQTAFSPPSMPKEMQIWVASFSKISVIVLFKRIDYGIDAISVHTPQPNLLWKGAKNSVYLET